MVGARSLVSAATSPETDLMGLAHRVGAVNRIEHERRPDRALVTYAGLGRRSAG